VLLPLGIGAAAGYWVSDRGVRWVPDTVAVLLLGWLLALLLMIAGSVLSGPLAGIAPKRKRIVFLGALALLAVAVRIGVHYASKPTPLAQRAPAEFAALIELDATQYRDLDRTLDGTTRALRSMLPQEGVLPADLEPQVAEAFTGWVDAAFALDQIRLFYEDYYRLDLSRLERDRHVQAFLLTFAAELALFEHAAHMIETVDGNPNAAKFLDLARPGLAEESLTQVKEELLGVSDFSRIVAGKRYLRYLAELHDADQEVASSRVGWLWRDVERRLARLAEKNPALVAVDSLASDFAPLGKDVKRVTFPVQKGVAAWMGDTRVKRAGRYLIGPELQASLEELLRPGDIMLARKNWYLSNVGLPGFWPHAMIYVGTNDDLAAAFDRDEAVRAWLLEETGSPISYTAYLSKRFPRAFSDRSSGDLVVIEAISEGVSQSDLTHTVGDYVAALRPNLPPVAKAKAIVRAFSFLGRPYDFDFDFATDDQLVCTELVWRSYRTQGGELGLHLPPSLIAGRLTLPANTFARVYRDERATAAPQLSFVAFIEGREQTGDARVADEAAFVATVDRSKWDMGQP
jgi:hypothetical protein